MIIQHVKILLFGLGLFRLATAQNLLYRDRYKEVEYNYAIIDSGFFEDLTETEKIKYELRYSEKIVHKRILEDYSSEQEIIYDSNGYSKDWLTLPRKVVYNDEGIHLYTSDNKVFDKITYTEEQLADRMEEKLDNEEHGYHPGLVHFPEGTALLFENLSSQGIAYENLGAGKFSVVMEGTKTTYDRNKLLITTEWTNTNGQKCKEYNGYLRMDNNKGYLHIVSKRETAVTSWNGLCLTEIALSYFTDYHIEDFVNLIGKSVQEVEQAAMMVVYPNPNNGLFTVAYHLQSGDEVMEVQILDILTGQRFGFNVIESSDGSMKIDASSISKGMYSVRLITKQAVFNSQFFKQ